MINTGIASQIFYFDIASLIILGIVFYSLLSRKVVVGSSNITFFLLGLCIFITTFFDTFNALFSNHINFIFNYTNLSARYLFLNGYFIFRNLTLPVYGIYLLVISGGWAKYFKHKRVIFLFFLPFIFLLILLIVNIFTNNVFLINEKYEYIRCKNIFYFYLISFFYFIMGYAILFHYKKIFSKDKFLSLCTMLPFNIIAVLIQLFHPNCLVECFCTTATFLLITFTVQKPEEQLDLRYSSYTVYAFKDDIIKHLLLKTNVSVILVGSKNYDVIKSILSPQDFENFKKSFSENLQSECKKYSYLGNTYYYGNGIFAIVSYKENKERALQIADVIEKSLSNGIKIGKANINISSSLCVVECPKEFTDYESLASFISKYQVFFSDIKGVVDLEKHSDHLNYKIKADINNVLSRGINDHGFMIYYQPIYSIEKNKFISAEALIRLNDPKWGFVSPEIFITAAEKNGTILHIGKLVIEEVCKFIASDVFKELGLEYIEINLSVAQCLQTDLVDVISSLLNKYNVNPHQINLEITEREDIFDQNIFIENLQKLQKMGISISLDDYGTGYSNILRIVDLPIEIVKIDKSFVDQYQKEEIKSIIRNTVKMLKEINKKIVVEGIETKESLESFSNLKCDYIQGYYFSKPLDQVSFVSKVMEMNEPKNLSNS